MPIGTSWGPSTWGTDDWADNAWVGGASGSSAGAVGNCWAPNTWRTDAWKANAWAGTVGELQPIPVDGWLDFEPLTTTLTFLAAPGGAEMLRLRFKQGEITPIVFVLRGPNRQPIDLTNATVLKWTVRKPGKTPIINAANLTRVAPYASGKVTFTPQAAQVAAAGRYIAEAYVQFSDGQEREYPNGGNAEVIIEPTLRSLG